MASRTVFSIFVFFLLSLYLVIGALTAMAEDPAVAVKVGVVLDSDTWLGKIGLSCMDTALSDFYASRGDYKTRLILHPMNSMGDAVGAAAAGLELINKEEVEAIVGPQSSKQAGFMAEIGKKSQVPIISFSATSSSLSSIRNPYFFQATQIDSSQVKSIAAIIEDFNWRRAVLIYTDDEYGEGIVASMRDALREINTRLAHQTAIPPSASGDRIARELYKLMTMQTRVFIVHMLPELGARVFAMAKEIGMMESGYVWIITDGIGNSLSRIDDSATDSMSGVLGVRTSIPKTPELEDFQLRWETKFRRQNPGVPSSMSKLNILCLRAHDAAFALAKAVEKAGTRDSGFKKPNVSGQTTDLDDFGVSQNGPKLSKALSETSFKGLAGEFSLVGGRLRSPTFEVINLSQKNITVVGFWTAEKGLEPTLDSTNTSKNPSVASLRHITLTWPGNPNSPSFPKGWEVPTNEKKLRFGVPVKSGMSKFVRKTRDPVSNRTKMTGYSIDVFEAVIEALPYAVFYEFIQFADDKGAMKGTYEDLVHQVSLGIYDAVVGDISIRESRSEFGDFTFPYSESSVSMVVLLENNKNKKAWLFLKPLTLDLWLTSSFSFIFIGLVIWFLEHRINEDFRGPPSHEIGTSVWFAFSTMVYAQREKVESHLARFVIIVWFFVVLILTQSYTASLTSQLTVEKLEPTICSMQQLLGLKNAKVGYPNGSFVQQLLEEEGFDRSRLVIYSTMAHCGELLLNKSIVAAFDEVPYLKVLVNTYCTNCTILGPMMRSNGFGFLFPRGSALGRDVSKATLDLMEAGMLREIEDKWFRANSSSPGTSSLVSSSLGLESFWGLFLIVAIASSSAIFLNFASFAHHNRHLLNLPSLSLWTRFLLLWKQFDRKDFDSPAMRRNRDDGGPAVEDLRFRPYPSPSCDSSCGNGAISPGEFDDSGFHGDRGEIEILQTSTAVEEPSCDLSCGNGAISPADADDFSFHSDRGEIQNLQASVSE